MAEINTSLYPQPAPPGNLLGMVGQFASAQNMMNQNLQFQQMYKAKQALGGVLQQSVDPDGELDWHKALALGAAHPDLGWMMPDLANQVAQRENLQQDTILKTFDIAAKRASMLGQFAGATVDKEPSPEVDQASVMGFGAQVHGLHLDAGGDGKDVLTFVAKFGHPVDPKTGQPDMSTQYNGVLAKKQLDQFRLSQLSSADLINKTRQNYEQKYGGGTLRGTFNAATGQVTPATGPGMQPGGVVPETSGPGVKQINPVTGAQTQSTVGVPLPAAPQGGPGIESLLGGGTGPGAAITPAAPGPGGNVTTALGPVQEARLKAMGPYTKETNDQGTKSLQMNQILDEMDKARSQFKTGGGMEGFVSIAKGLQAMGIKDSVVDRVAGGDLGSAQEYSKLQAQLAAAVLKNALMPGAGRILQSEYQTFTKANANWDTDPRGIDKMFTFMRNQNGINIQRMNYLNAISQAANKGEALPKGMTDLTDFEPWFNKKLIQHGVISDGTKKVLEKSGPGALP